MLLIRRVRHRQRSESPTSTRPLLCGRETQARSIGNAIVWQDRRIAKECASFKEDGLEPTVTKLTGLLLDPYFSASKIAWILKNTSSASERAARGKPLFGIADNYLIWRLTNGKCHVTDLTNACRTMLVNIGSGQWNEDLLDMFDIPRVMLPEITDCAAEFGTTAPSIFGSAVPILGVAGDQQAAAIGQACFQSGRLKSTYGTGCFALLNTGRSVATHKIDCSPRLHTAFPGRPLTY